jgi:Ca2+/Na+ antiporter
MIGELNQIVRKLKWSSDVIGIMLLNVGNGIPDLITSLLMLKNDVPLVVSAAVGSAVFILTVSLAMIILYSRGVEKLGCYKFYRNIFFLIGMYGFIVYHLASRKITILTSLSMIATYICCVLYSFMTSNAYDESLENVEISRTPPKSGGFYRVARTMIIQPMKVVLDVITISLKKDGELRRYCRALFSPTLNFLLLFIYFQFPIRYVYAIPLMLGLLLTGVAFGHLVKRGKGYVLLHIYSFVVCGVWIYVISSEILSLMEFYEKKMNMKRELSSMTILSWGNCLGDLITGIAGSKNGMFKTVAHSTMISPVHNTLFNLGAIFTLIALKNGGSIDFIPNNGVLTVGLAFLPITILILIINYEVRNKKLASELAYILLFLYGMFILFCIIVASQEVQ